MQLILHSFFYLKLLLVYMKRKIISLLFILALQHNLCAQKVDFNSPEGWGMSYMTAVSYTHLPSPRDKRQSRMPSSA